MEFLILCLAHAVSGADSRNYEKRLDRFEDKLDQKHASKCQSMHELFHGYIIPHKNIENEAICRLNILYPSLASKIHHNHPQRSENL